MKEILFDSYEPDYNRCCCNCGQSPIVTAVNGDDVVYDSEMCGPCTFGTAKALDLDWWNSDD